MVMALLMTNPDGRAPGLAMHRPILPVQGWLDGRWTRSLVRGNGP